MKRALLLYALVGSATVALSQLVSAWRSWEVAPTLAGGVAVGLLAVALLGAMGWLGFILYEADWEVGQVPWHIGLYEWVLSVRPGPVSRIPGGPPTAKEPICSGGPHP
jgi:hypothetical protein